MYRLNILVALIEIDIAIALFIRIKDVHYLPKINQSHLKKAEDFTDLVMYDMLNQLILKFFKKRTTCTPKARMKNQKLSIRLSIAEASAIYQFYQEFATGEQYNQNICNHIHQQLININHILG